MERYPLLVKYRQLVAGAGFISHIEIMGRVLATKEPAGYWLDSVNPGQVSAGGVTLGEAYAALRQEITTTLIDLAFEADGFKSFEAAIHRFFSETDSETEAEWCQALLALRSGHGPATELGLPRLSGEDPRGVRVLELNSSEFSAELNAVDKEPALAA